jgi:hypothetical protein
MPRAERHAVTKTGDSPLCARRVVRIRALVVRGGVDHSADLGHAGANPRLDALPQRDVRHAAALTTAVHGDVRDAVLHLEQLDEAPSTRSRD